MVVFGALLLSCVFLIPTVGLFTLPLFLYIKLRRRRLKAKNALKGEFCLSGEARIAFYFCLANFLYVPVWAFAVAVLDTPRYWDTGWFSIVEIMPFFSPHYIGSFLAMYALFDICRDPHLKGEGRAAATILISFLAISGFLFFAPIAPKYREAPRRPACRSNLKQIGLAVHMYAEGCEGYLPPDFMWLYPSFIANPNAFRCPYRKDYEEIDLDDEDRFEKIYDIEARTIHTDYIYEVDQGYLKRITDDPNLIIAYDKESNHVDENGNCKFQYVLFLDGHVETMAPEELREALEDQRKRLQQQGE